MSPESGKPPAVTGADVQAFGLFLDLSRYLTGIDDLEIDLAGQYLARFRGHPKYGDILPELMGVFSAIDLAAADAQAAVRRTIMEHPILGTAARQLIYLWYVGAFFEPYPLDKTQRAGSWRYGSDAEHYGRGLMWSVVQGHAPMTPGEGAGSWASRPHLDTRPGTPPAGWLDLSEVEL